MKSKEIDEQGQLSQQQFYETIMGIIKHSKNFLPFYTSSIKWHCKYYAATISELKFWGIYCAQIGTNSTSSTATKSFSQSTTT